MLLSILALAVPFYTLPPQTQAIRILGSTSKKPPVVRRVNVAGRYATVLTAGGTMEGAPAAAPILFERFLFGWQALDVLNFRCRLNSHGFAPRVNAALMQGMPAPNDDGPCERGRDEGAPDDVAAVRRLMPGLLVPYVVVAGRWALGHWYGAGGGQALFRKNGGRWRLLKSGGGAMGIAQMRAYGVPQQDWCIFHIYDANCR